MSDPTSPDEKSRSQIKREFRELKELGKQLARLSKGQLGAIPLAERTREAVLAIGGMTRGAMQRQYKYIGSLLAEENLPSVRAALSGEVQPHNEEVAAFKETESWRERLLSDDASHLAEFVRHHPQCDRTHLRQLIRNARRERELDKAPKSARQLFRYLRELAEADD